MLRDRLVCSVNNEQLQHRLLAEPRLTFAKAMELSQTFKSATEDARKLQDETKHTQPQPVHKLTEGADAPVNFPRPHQVTCYRCGENHKAASCRFKQTSCHLCKKQGHIAKMCSSRKGATTQKPTQSFGSRPVYQVTSDLEDKPDEQYAMYNLPGSQPNPIQVTLNIENRDVLMEVDAGASRSIMSERTYRSFPHTPELQLTKARLHTYTGEDLPVLGSISVSVCHNQQQKTLSLLVVRGEGPNLLVRDWLEQLQLDWTTIHKLHCLDDLQVILDRHAAVFKDELRH